MNEAIPRTRTQNNTPKCILIVDDDQDILDSLKNLLEAETHHHIVTASTPSMVLEVLNHTRPDIALLDIRLSNSSGLELIPMLREYAGDIVCIMMTAYRDIDYAVEAVRAGANDYLFKPLEPRALLSNLQATLDEQQHNRDLHQQSEQERQFKAQCDPLTGLPGRMILNHRLTSALATASRSHQAFALMFIDLDHFKQVNDTLGHHAGDRLLVMAAERMQTCIREEDVISRLGGDEFVVLLGEDANRQTATEVAQRLLASIDQMPLLEEQQQAVTISIGIALFPQDGRDAITLLKHADQAMYNAKHQGKNGFCFFSDD